MNSVTTDVSMDVALANDKVRLLVLCVCPSKMVFFGFCFFLWKQQRSACWPCKQRRQRPCQNNSRIRWWSSVHRWHTRVLATTLLVRDFTFLRISQATFTLTCNSNTFIQLQHILMKIMAIWLLILFQFPNSLVCFYFYYCFKNFWFSFFLMFLENVSCFHSSFIFMITIIYLFFFLIKRISWSISWRIGNETWRVYAVWFWFLQACNRDWYIVWCVIEWQLACIPRTLTQRRLWHCSSAIGINTTPMLKR